MTEPKEERGMVVTDLGQWFTPLDPREIHRREVGEQQRRSVKRRRRRPKTGPRKDGAR